MEAREITDSLARNLNLATDPAVHLQVSADHFSRRAHTADGAERERLSESMLRIFPTYSGMQRKTQRELPVVVIERTEVAG
ncbi:nitroreductase/quinone reductase family protein [Nonomuraea sp. NEAU-A123]|uniref:nitroreductase/quinone reductase family protein n=1 Tax=Nonomuraea sp. NEAU-A123 TaxID=2839649 RepID=UPI001BE3D976|nr:nitroreductase/quinone reductase family protein [Nonomuraea sp. NEAU-A123]MBT2225826.1 nitroreductase family deazaflavin-dependent oxidoreductase [Nonomuraea sp. NEAU-A123]